MSAFYQVGRQQALAKLGFFAPMLMQQAMRGGAGGGGGQATGPQMGQRAWNAGQQAWGVLKNMRAGVGGNSPTLGQMLGRRSGPL
jgi:hypothetical protein